MWLEKQDEVGISDGLQYESSSLVPLSGQMILI